MTATLVDWIFAPDRLTLAQAGELTGYDHTTLDRIAVCGGVDTWEENSRVLIDRESLREYQESLLCARVICQNQ